MINISQGKIRLEKTIIDISEFKIRPKTTEQDLEKYYDEFIAHAQVINEYFEDKDAFDKALKEASQEKRPKLIPRETKYPFMWAFRTAFMPFDFLRPSERRLNDKYFIASRCLTAIPKKIKPGEKAETLDRKLIGDIAEKFKGYPGCEGIIEIPNDRTPAETKASLFHEAFHYLTLKYLADTGRDITKTFVKRDMSHLEKYQTEHFLYEISTEILTDKLLAHDPDAQFEERWIYYPLYNTPFALVTTISTLATAFLIGFSVAKPYLLPLALIPGRLKDYVVNKHKKSMRKELLKEIKYPEFKI